jgi:molybdopterin synthase sulfur carrier subunit
MIISVKLFAAARQLAGEVEQVELDLPDDANVADLRRELALAVPALAPLLPLAMIAMDTEYVGDDTKLIAGVEIACIPPVSGG